MRLARGLLELCLLAGLWEGVGADKEGEGKGDWVQDDGEELQRKWGFDVSVPMRLIL